MWREGIEERPGDHPTLPPTYTHPPLAAPSKGYEFHFADAQKDRVTYLRARGRVLPAQTSAASSVAKQHPPLSDSLCTGLSPSAVVAASPSAARMGTEVSRGCHWTSPLLVTWGHAPSMAPLCRASPAPHVFPAVPALPGPAVTAGCYQEFQVD